MTISIITSGRNDNYGGDFLGRALKAYAINRRWQTVAVEWIFVEWQPLTHHWLSYILAPLGFRCYVVSPGIHREILHPDYPNFEFFHSHALNVGIRRATGDWILSSNIDVIYSPQVWAGMAGELDHNKLYRARRVDVAEDDVSRLFTEFENLDVLLDHKRAAYGDFLLFPEERRKGFDEAVTFARIHQDCRWMTDYQRRYQAKLCFLGDLYKIDHNRTWLRDQQAYKKNTGTCTTWKYKEKTAPGSRGLYENPDSWGFADRVEIPIAKNITYIGVKRK